MSLFHRDLPPGHAEALGKSHHAVFVWRGAVTVGDMAVAAGDGAYASETEFRSEGGAEILVFRLGDGPDPAALMSERLDWTGDTALFRLDQVRFPPRACAYRHTHPGPGIRCLIEGTLKIQSDRHVEEMTRLSAWFEAAESPVKATAGDVETAFVRAMLLPPEYLGKPTLNVLDPVDAAKERLQTNRRFVDQILRLPFG